MKHFIKPKTLEGTGWYFYQFSLAVIFPILYILSFPPYSVPFLGFLSLVPFFLLIETRSHPLIFLSGSASFFLLNYWLVDAISRYGGLPRVIAFSMIVLLSMYLASYLFIFSLFFEEASSERFSYIIIPSLFLALENIRSHFLTGFPWGIMGLTMEKPIELLQTASFIGAAGCSFIVVMVNFMVYKAIKGKKVYIAASVLVVLSLYTIGKARLHHCREHKGSWISVTICQPNIDQGVKWDERYVDTTFSILYSLFKEGKGSDLILFPETAIPGYLNRGSYLFDRTIEIVKRFPVFLGTGALYRDKYGNDYNSFFLISPDLSVERYDKIHLVPFGEYFPLSSKFSFLKKLSLSGNFNSGRRFKVFHIKNCSFGVLICFESIFPEMSKRYIELGADFLINITNDGWFGLSPGPYQHFSFSIFRAVENGVWLIRCANTGISAFISPYGNVVKFLGLNRRGVLKMRFLCEKVHTFYLKFGHIFPFYASLLAFLWLALRINLLYKKLNHGKEIEKKGSESS